MNKTCRIAAAAQCQWSERMEYDGKMKIRLRRCETIPSNDSASDWYYWGRGAQWGECMMIVNIFSRENFIFSQRSVEFVLLWRSYGLGFFLQAPLYEFLNADFALLLFWVGELTAKGCYGYEWKIWFVV